MSSSLKDILKGTILIQEGEREGDTQRLFYHRLIAIGIFDDQEADEAAGSDSQRVYFITDRVSAQRNTKKGGITPLGGIMPSCSVSPTELLKYTLVPMYEVPERIVNDLMRAADTRKTPPIKPEGRTIYRFTD